MICGLQEEVAMRSGLVLSSLAVALLFGGPAIAQQSPATMPQGMPSQGQIQPQAQTPSQGRHNQQLSDKDKRFVKQAAIGGMTEVELGKLAQQNAQDDQVKQFGQRMVRDHSAANQQLMSIANDEDVKVPRHVKEKQQKTIDRLANMRGADFDRAYIREMVEDHDKAVKKFRREAQHATDPQLKAFAQKTLPTLEEHQKMAHDLNKSLTAVGSSHEPQSEMTR
jgi:putative membrane protein